MPDGTKQQEPLSALPEQNGAPQGPPNGPPLGGG
jgi:hypothetical protein